MIPFHTDIVDKELEISLKGEEISGLFNRNEVGKLGNNFAQFRSWLLQISHLGYQKLLDETYLLYHAVRLGLDYMVRHF